MPFGFGRDKFKKEGFEKIGETEGAVDLSGLTMGMIEANMKYKSSNYLNKAGTIAYADVTIDEIDYGDSPFSGIGELQTKALKGKHIYYFLSKAENKEIITFPVEENPGTLEIDNMVLNGEKDRPIDPDLNKLYKSHSELAQRKGAEPQAEYLKAEAGKLPGKIATAMEKLIEETFDKFF